MDAHAEVDGPVARGNVGFCPSPTPMPTTAPPPPKPLKETEAGNYFVSNYPPYAYWRQEQVPEVARVLDGPPQPQIPLGVYFHIPFCRKRCHFCYFRVYTDKNAEEIKRYLRAGMEEFSMFVKRRYREGRKPHFVYFGGGTPSYLSVFRNSKNSPAT